MNNGTLKFEELLACEINLFPSSEQVPKLELKHVSVELKCDFLGPVETSPVVISSKLDSFQESKLLNDLRNHKGAIGWNISDIKGISPLVCTHRIYLEDNAKPSREMKCRLNPTMKEVVRIEVLKLLDVIIIYPIVVDSLQESKLLNDSRNHNGAIGWNITDIKGINPLVFTQRIYFEDNTKPYREMKT